jgi:hypothetical protein
MESVVKQTDSSERMKSVAIVGAGIRGLSSAAFFKSRGYRVTVFEKSNSAGGIWTRVFPSSVINTPAHGYTFHADNIWPMRRANAQQILTNVDRMIDREQLEPEIRLNTSVESVTKSPSLTWRINGEEPEYDGLLVATGYMGRPKEAPSEIKSAFRGRILRPYGFEPESLRGNRVVVVGSGETALEMLTVAVREECEHASLITHPGVELRGIRPYSHLAFCVSGSPFVYPRTKSRDQAHRVNCDGVEELLESNKVEVSQSAIREANEDQFFLMDGQRLQADVLIWCSGWDPLLPRWVSEFLGDPKMVLASCKRCLDTGGFGNGTSTAHAKALHAALAYNLETPFTSESDGCKCDQHEFQHTRHILMSLLSYFYQQPRGWSILGENLAYGWISNWQRLWRSREPWWAKLAAFINAPFGT